VKPNPAGEDLLRQYTELKLLEQFLTTFDTEVLEKLQDEGI
jgi:hypothetical protein